MKKYKNMHPAVLGTLQQQLDARFGRRVFKAIAILLLGACLSLVSCQQDGKEPSGELPGETAPPPGQPQATTKPDTGKELPAPRATAVDITIKDTTLKQTVAKPPAGGDYVTGACVVDAYFADKDVVADVYTKITNSVLGQDTYIIIDTMHMAGEEVTVKILDRDKIMAGAAYGTITFMQYAEKDKGKFADKASGSDGIFKVKVRNDGFAVIKVQLASSDKSTTTKWSKAIGKTEAKTADLCIAVESSNSSIQFLGINIDDKENSEAGKKNYWLNTNGKWFKLYPCFCNKPFEIAELQRMMYKLRSLEYSDEPTRKALFDLNVRQEESQMPEADKTYARLRTELNAALAYGGVTTCIRKSHFFGQTHVESYRFRRIYENLATVPSNYSGGFYFQGRGIKQITHDYNYLAYYDHVNQSALRSAYDYARRRTIDGSASRGGSFSVADIIAEAETRRQTQDVTRAALEAKLASIPNDKKHELQKQKAQKNLDNFNALVTKTEYLVPQVNTDLQDFTVTLAADLQRACQSAGWYWKYNDLGDTSILADADDVLAVSKRVNNPYGKPNALTERTKFTNYLRDNFFNYESCINHP